MFVAWWIAIACQPEPATAPGAAGEPLRLVRASMAARGVRPSLAELERHLADAGSLEEQIRGWLDDPRFAARVRDQYAEALRLRTANVGKLPAIGPLSAFGVGDIARSLDEAPLHRIAEVATSGQPFTHILRGHDTWADPIVAAAYGLPYDLRGPRWQRSRWTDGRPAAGILSDTAFLQRYQSSLSNHHRARADATLRALTCRDLVVDAAYVGGAPQIAAPSEDAIRADPACVGCHAVLDPVASAFAGFPNYILPADVREAYSAGCPSGAPCLPLRFWGEPTTPSELPDPAWKGAPVSGLEGLAEAIAADPAFAACAARRAHAWNTGRAPHDVPDAVVEDLTERFIQSSLDYRELMVASLTHPDLLAAPARTIRPEELARTIEALTGYRWEGEPDALGCHPAGCYGRVALAESASHGYRAALGGTDGWSVLEPAEGASPTAALALAWLAEEAAFVVVERADPAIFRHAGPGPAPEAAVREQLASLHRDWLSEPVRPDGPEVSRDLDLFQAVESASGAEAAWRLVITALLQDDRLVVF